MCERRYCSCVQGRNQAGRIGGMETYRGLKDSNIDQPLIIGFLALVAMLLIVAAVSPGFRAYWRRRRRWYGDSVPLTVYSAVSAAAVPLSLCLVGALVRMGVTTDWLLVLPGLALLHFVASVFIDDWRMKKHQG